MINDVLMVHSQKTKKEKREGDFSYMAYSKTLGHSDLSMHLFNVGVHTHITAYFIWKCLFIHFK